MTAANFANYVSKPSTAQCHEVQSNIHVVVQNGILRRGTSSFKNNQTVVELGFNMGGPINFTLHKNSDNGEEIEITTGVAHISVYSFQSGVMEYTKDQAVNWLGIILPLELFQSYFEMSLQKYLGKPISDSGMASRIVGPINAEMQAALRQIMLCRYMGKTRCLFLKSKVLELISYMRFYADGGETVRSHSFHLSSTDWERMWQAKRVLDQNLENPPSIIELSRQVGVNEFKLKNGFREVHGITPYRYVAEQRLERASNYLRERRMNVTEAAFAVGYSSLSHFSKIFRERFGLTPHEYSTRYCEISEEAI